MRHQIKINGQRKSALRQGFTLVEVLVALFVFSLLMVIILVPLNMGFTMMHLGKAQSDVQSATQEVVDQMRNDLTHAVYVFPNAQISPVTDKAPYLYYDSSGDTKHYGPYVKLGIPEITPTTAPASVCGVASTDASGVSNLSRLDMLLPRTNGVSILTPLQPSYYIVSYYARRRVVVDTNGNSVPYHPIDNPIVLFRAQIPYYQSDGAGYLMRGSSFNADITNNRYGISCSDQGSWWLAESTNGEPNLEYLTESPSGYTGNDFTLYGSHVSMLPTDIGMVTGFDYRGYDSNNQPITKSFYPPKSTFICADTNSDGVIDEVRLNVLLQNATPGSSGSNGPQINLPQVVDLPNVRTFANLH